MPNPGSRQTGTSWILILVLLALAAGGVALYFLFSGMRTAVTTSFVTHPPGATVWVDGRIIEGKKTPIKGHLVVFGSTNTVVVHIQKKGYRPWTKHLTPDELGKLGTIELEPEPGVPPPPATLVDVVTTPTGARVRIDGQEAGTSPVTAFPLAPGSTAVHIEASLDGYLPAETRVARDRLSTAPIVTLVLRPASPSPRPARHDVRQVSPRPEPVTRRKSATTRPKPSSSRPVPAPMPRPTEPPTFAVQVSGDPPGARVAVNGRSVGDLTPLEFRARRGEDLVIDIMKPGFEHLQRHYTAEELRRSGHIRYALAPITPAATPKPVRATPMPARSEQKRPPVTPPPATSPTPRPDVVASIPDRRTSPAPKPREVEQRLTLISDPPGAEVFVNGEHVGKTALKDFTVRTRGDLTVAMRLPGYQEARRTLTLQELTRPVTWTATLEPIPLDPSVCDGAEGDRWMERLNSSDPITDYDVLRKLRACFQTKRNWQGVIAVTNLALVHPVYGGLPVDYYARAVALKELGGTGNYKLCAQAARLAAVKKTGLEQIELWEAWYLELYCLHGYLARSRTDVSGKWDDPSELEYKLKTRYVALKNDIINKIDTLPPRDQAEVRTIEFNLETLKKEMGW